MKTNKQDNEQRLKAYIKLLNDVYDTTNYSTAIQHLDIDSITDISKRTLRDKKEDRL
jgi:hypothetical protein